MFNYRIMYLLQTVSMNDSLNYSPFFGWSSRTLFRKHSQTVVYDHFLVPYNSSLKQSSPYVPCENYVLGSCLYEAVLPHSTSSIVKTTQQPLLSLSIPRRLLGYSLDLLKEKWMLSCTLSDHLKTFNILILLRSPLSNWRITARLCFNIL